MEITSAKKLRQNADRAAKLLHVLANTERLMILCQLIGGPAGILVKRYQISNPL